MSIALKAMLFAMEKHKDQKRKWTGNPYFEHLAEVAGIVASVYRVGDIPLASAWLHDVVEDQGVSPEEIEERFGFQVRMAVLALSDLEDGDRDTRKELSRQRLSKAPGWVQTIKVADIISNTGSTMKHDPAFAEKYFSEKRLLLPLLKDADPLLLQIAWKQVSLVNINE